LVDALGKLVRFLLLPGQSHDMKGVAPRIPDVSFDTLMAIKHSMQIGSGKNWAHVAQPQ